MSNTSREDAARQVFELYVNRLKGLVRLQLDRRILAKAGGTSELVISALGSFFKGNPNLNDPESIWPLLATITKRKAFDAANRFKTGSRRIDREVESSTIEDDEGFAIDVWDIDRFRTSPTFDEAAVFIEVLEFLCEEQQQLVMWRLDGDSYQEIGQKLAEKERRAKPYDEKTIQRRFQSIRRKLELDFAPPNRTEGRTFPGHG